MILINYITRETFTLDIIFSYFSTKTPTHSSILSVKSHVEYQDALRLSN
jgi:hypothetical protein